MSVKKTILVLFALAVAARLAALVATFPGNENVTYYDDAKIALNLVRGQGYSIDYDYRNWLFYEMFMKHERLQNPIVEGVKPTASKQPAYPLLLALLFVMFGAGNFLAVFLLHAALAGGTAILLYISLRRISPLTGLLGGLSMALYPPFVVHSVTKPESTTLLLFLVSLFFVCFLRLVERASIRRWLILGALSAALALTEPVTLPFALLSLLYAAYLTWPARAARSGLVLSGLVFAILLSPWLIRNYVVFDRFPVMKSVVGVVFNWGLERSGHGTWISDQRLAELEYAGRASSELEEDEAIRRELQTLFPSHWKEYVLVNLPLNFRHFWWEVARYSDDTSLTFSLGRKLPYVFILILALPALIPWRRGLSQPPGRAPEAESRIRALALILMATLTIVYTVFGAYMSRYRFPAELALLALASHTMARVATRLMEKLPADFPGKLLLSQERGQ
ncbi:MAG TPA: glycosyltransferase family 39 protein [Terriglobia bacterium]|nr:glycosyltransferase family 39 protein [Terriglobia bacterium]